MDLGGSIRARRTALGLNLDALADRSGVSRAMLSDIERGAKNPTVKVVSQIAAGLGCTVSDLLGEPAPGAPDALQVVRQGERRVLIDPQSGVERHLLAPAFVRRNLEIVWYSIPPGQSTGAFPPHPAGTAEHLTVVEGQLRCRLGTEEVLLAAGDSLFFPADVAHAFANPGAVPCHYFLVIDSRRGPG